MSRLDEATYKVELAPSIPAGVRNSRVDGAGAAEYVARCVCAGPQSFRRILVSETDRPSMKVRWSHEHIRGWKYTFTRQRHDFLLAVRAGADPGLSTNHRSNVIPIYHPSQHAVGA